MDFKEYLDKRLNEGMGDYESIPRREKTATALAKVVEYKLDVVFNEFEKIIKNNFKNFDPKNFEKLSIVVKKVIELIYARQHESLKKGEIRSRGMNDTFEEYDTMKDEIKAKRAIKYFLPKLEIFYKEFIEIINGGLENLNKKKVYNLILKFKEISFKFLDILE